MAIKQKTNVLTDYSRMPFGKHEGKEMANVPASYLMWFYQQNWPVIEYIRDNMDAIQQELNQGRSRR